MLVLLTLGKSLPSLSSVFPSVKLVCWTSQHFEDFSVEPRVCRGALLPTTGPGLCYIPFYMLGFCLRLCLNNSFAAKS